MLLCSVHRPIPGIPCFEPDYQMTEKHGYTTVSPWGLVQGLTGRDLGTHNLYNFDFFKPYEDPSSPPGRGLGIAIPEAGRGRR